MNALRKLGILLSVLAILFGFGAILFSCGTATTTDSVAASELAEKLAFRTDLLELIDKFGTAEEVDYSSYEDGTVYDGAADLLAYKRGEDVSLILADDNRMLYVEFFLEPGTPTTLEIWGVDFRYQDPVEQVYVYVSYYHYGDWFLEDYRSETYDAVFADFLEDVDRMTMDDWLLFLEDLGHYTPKA